MHVERLLQEDQPGHPLARRRTVSMRDFGGRVVAVDARTGTTTVDLWPPDHAPSATRDTQDMEEWLALIAAGHASGMTTEATAYQHPRPGIVYRRVRDAPSVPVWLAWWRDDPPAQLDEVVALASGLYAAPGA
ncbi:LysR substrate-binding domain-containing protein [Ornithinimicrobium panacihumi]|uniref:LysR substrate-binding domain-containing protein n=1 Tax=Ornithinimicrobium panacihumi TaxID=2008449 RepID=UPI003F887DA5